MKNLTVRSATKAPNWSASRPHSIDIPANPETTAADRLLYLKDCLDKEIIDKNLFRALRDELTYGTRLRN